MIETPVLVQTSVQPTAVIRLTLPRSEIQAVMGLARREVMAAVAGQGMSPTGPWFSYHHKMEPGMFDMEVGVPIAGGIEPVGRVIAGTLRAARVARTTYVGSYEKLGAGWGELMQWIAGQGLTPAPDLWEFYVRGPESGGDSSQYRTELNRPID